MKNNTLVSGSVFLILLLVVSGCEPDGSSVPYGETGKTEKRVMNKSNAQDENDVRSHSDPLFEDVHERYDVSPERNNWHLEEWANSKPLSLNDLKGNVAVVRFWTNTCPYCARSMPVLQDLKEQLEGEPVRFIGLYHSKPYGSERPWSKAVKMTEDWGVTFPIAYDRNWNTLKDWWLSSGKRQATSCTFVLNKQGQVTYIHPGPVYAPGDPEESEAARDFEQLTRAIHHALGRSGTVNTDE